MTDSDLVKFIYKTSAERVALDLLERVAYIEWKRIGANQEYRTATDREWLLGTYAECLEAVRGHRPANGPGFVADRRKLLETSDGPDTRCGR